MKIYKKTKLTKDQIIKVFNNKLVNKPMVIYTGIDGEESTNAEFYGKVEKDSIFFYVRPSYTQGAVKEVNIVIEEKPEENVIIASWNDFNSSDAKSLVITLFSFIAILQSVFSVVNHRYLNLAITPVIILIGIIMGIITKKIVGFINMNYNRLVSSKIDNLLVGICE